MDRDGVLNLKADLFTGAYGFDHTAVAQWAGDEPVFAPREGSQAFDAIDQARREGQREARDLIALGTLMAPERRGLRLGVFVQRRNLVHHPIVQKARAAGGGEVKVIYTGPIRRHTGLSASPVRPLRIGTSIAHCRVTAGTLGCFAVRRADREVGLLSNNHVLAATNTATVGDIILQPGKLDGGLVGNVAHHVAELRSMVRLDFGAAAVNFVDAAFARLLPGIACVSDRVAASAGTGSEWRIAPQQDVIVPTQAVKKVGRTTGMTRGTVVAVAVNNLSVAYRFGQSYGTARFDGAISIEGVSSAFSKPGDSGSLIFTDDDRPMALLMAGSETGGARGVGLTYAAPIDAVLSALDIDIHR